MCILKNNRVTLEYSIARTYQLKENLDLMEMFTRILVPFITIASPAFIFNLAYILIPKGIGYDWIRYFSVAIYDLWRAIISAASIALIPLSAPKIAKKMPLHFRYCLYAEVKTEQPRNPELTTHTYFTLFQEQWLKVNPR
ncbi:hypothetical protein PMAYCL1PPCAC_19525, partial [Pristionchus mayeri]